MWFILFFEFNSKILDENPFQSTITSILLHDKQNDYIADLTVLSFSVVFPEDSQRPNYACINITESHIQIKRKDNNLKLELAPRNASPISKIIDLKTYFNPIFY